MPEPAPISVAKNSTQRMKKRADKCDAIKCCQPERNKRLFFHPICFSFFLHAKKMHSGTATFLHEAPKRLDIIMMDTASVNAQPFAFPIFHQEQSDMRVLKIFIGLNRFQIRTAKNKSVRAERIRK